MIERMRIQLDGIINDKDAKEKLKSIEAELSKVGKIRDYARLEIDSDTGYVKSCLCINENMHTDARTMTVLEFETAMRTLKERNDELQKNIDKRNKRKH